jgi:hypothetical protein
MSTVVTASQPSVAGVRSALTSARQRPAKGSAQASSATDQTIRCATISSAGMLASALK